MSTRRLYLTCVGSYLTGWVFAQAVYNRVRKHVLERDWEKYKHELAAGVADEIDSRRDPLDMHCDETTEYLARAVEAHGPLTVGYSTGLDQYRVGIYCRGEESHEAEGYGETLPEALRRAALVVNDW